MTARVCLLVLLLTTACSKREQPAVERLAILPFELLSAEGETDLVGPALLANALAAVPNLNPIPVDSMEQAYARHANRFLHTYLVVTRGSKLKLEAGIEDARSHKMSRNLHIEGDRSSGMGWMLAKLAKEISPEAKVVAGPSTEAYEQLNRALQTADFAAQDEAFAAALKLDPHFGAAYEDWTKVLLARGNRDRAAEIAQKGEAAGVNDFSQVTLTYLQARAQADNETQISALKKLLALAPSDSEAYEHLGELQFAGRHFADSAAAYREALRLDPANGTLENMHGYAEAFAGNMDQARVALKTYGEAAPEQQGNALDSLGEVDFGAGDFAGADAAFLAAQEKNSGSGDWLKAAQARLLMGDLAGADQIFARFSKKPSVYQQAQWDFLTGRRKRALEKLQAEAGESSGDAAALLWAQIAIWQLQMGDRAGAGASVRKVMAQPASPARNARAGLATFLVQGGSPSSGVPFVDALSLIFRQDFQAALPLLEQVYARTIPTTDGQVRVLLAWASIETGHFDRARELLRIVPIPLASGDPMFTSLIFPRYFALRAALLAREGKQTEAQKDRQLFDRYSAN